MCYLLFFSYLCSRFQNSTKKMVKTLDFKPKMISAIRNYNKKTFIADLMAGIIVGIVALPLAIAFGIASGVSPEKGIITAIVAGLFISLFGGSKVQIGGPTGLSSLSSMASYSSTACRDSPLPPSWPVSSSFC